MWHDAGKKNVPKINILSPPDGLETPGIVPPDGLESELPRPPDGTIRPLLPTLPRPPDGNHLEKPFCTGESGLPATVQSTPMTLAASDTWHTDVVEDGQIERVRERDLDPALYDPTTGEYFAVQPAPAQRNRHAADAWVATALQGR